MSLPGVELGARLRGGACRAADIPKLELKNKIANTMILKCLRDFRFSRNQKPKLTDDY